MSWSVSEWSVPKRTDEHQIRIGAVKLWVKDDDPMYEAVASEILGEYGIHDIPFHKGDRIIDIGAHAGLVSSYIAKRHQNVFVYAYEPVPELFGKLVWGLRRNKIENVKPFRLAVSADGRDLTMLRGQNSGEATAFHPNSVIATGKPFTVNSTTVPQILQRNRIERVKLLKLDCEGAEHEILANSAPWIDKVEFVRGEIHMQFELAAAGYSIKETKNRVRGARARWMEVTGI